MNNNVKSLSDEQVVQLVIKEDQDLYEILVRRYDKKLLKYIQHYVQEEDKALDVVQETFIKAFINLNGFNQKLKFSSWIYRIAHNEAINYIKKYEREISSDKNDWVKNIKDHYIDLEGDFRRQETKEKIREALKKLSLKYQEVLWLYFFEEKSYEEISDILRISVGTVGTQINRGKRLLGEIIKQGGYYG